MKILCSYFQRLRSLFRRERLDRELNDELAAHLEMHLADNLRAGMSPDNARRDALLKLGGVEQTKESYRERRGLPLLESLLQDVRFGLRMNGARDELLACAGGTDKQDVRIVPRDFASKVEDLEHHRAFTDNAVEFEVLQKLFLQRATATPLVVQVRDIVERGLQADVIDRFGQKIGGAAADNL
jgi:hypothetical protein